MSITHLSNVMCWGPSDCSKLYTPTIAEVLMARELPWFFPFRVFHVNIRCRCVSAFRVYCSSSICIWNSVVAECCFFQKLYINNTIQRGGEGGYVEDINISFFLSIFSYYNHLLEKRSKLNYLLTPLLSWLKESQLHC